jgi:hypothetical protein
MLEQSDTFTPEPDHTQDIFAFVQDSASVPPTQLGRPETALLEVSQIWGQTLLDARHFSARSLGRDVTIGNEIGTKWHLLGIDVGWVSPRLASVLPFVPPMWSEVLSVWRNDFTIPTEPQDDTEHTLFVHDLSTETYTARLKPSWDAFVDIGDDRLTLETCIERGLATERDGLIQIPMTPGLRLLVDVDGVVFLGHLVPRGSRAGAHAPETPDYPFLGLFSFMGFLAMLFAGVMWFSPLPPVVTTFDIDEDFFANLQISEPAPEPEPSTTPEGTGAQAKGDEGERGPKTKNAAGPKGSAIAKQTLNRQVAESAGIISTLRTSALFSSTALGTTLTSKVQDLNNAHGWAPGRNGLGQREGGLGGGGDYDDIGSNMGTHGPGTGRNGYGVGPTMEKTWGDPTTIGGAPLIIGALDSALIDQVIKRHMSQIKYCYARQLNQNPKLGGKISIKFVIANDGSVSNGQVKTSTMNNAAVEDCMVRQFQRMQFPPPKGNGIVIVSYPFLFTRGR